ncbi:unnamed protein product [uncultured bacterium]|nr:unnamed protein product [uncultured bacterium]
MPSQDRRAAGRRRAWGRGPIILKFDSLEARELLSLAPGLPDLVNSSLVTSTTVSDWQGNLEVLGQITNQGGSITPAPVEVDIYASPIRGIDRYSVLIGQVMIPAGLVPGQSIPYQTSVNLPKTPIPMVSSSGGTVYIDAVVNPGRTIAESNYHNNEDIGPPHDAAPILIQPQAPSNLVGTTLAVTPAAPSWGNTITVTAQITNQGTGASPQTRAILALTPQGLNYGGTTTVAIGNIIVPPLAPYQTINLVQNITLPAVAPIPLTNYTNFGLTMTQDGDYVTNDLYAHQPDQGLGYDQTAITITTSPTSTATLGPLPDLAASSVLVPKSTLTWGSSVQVSTDVQNLGQGDAGQFLVRFLLTGKNGSINDAIFLADAVIPGLKSGFSQQIDQTLQLPIRLPSGVTLNNVGYARIAVLVDPENVINESLKSNNASLSAPFMLRLPGNSTTVPTARTAGALPSVQTLAEQAKNQAKIAAAARRMAKLNASSANGRQRKLHRKLGRSGKNFVKSTVSVAEELTKLPGQAFKALKKSL